MKTVRKSVRNASFIAAASVLALGLVACGSDPKPEVKSPETTSAPASTDMPTPPPATPTAPTADSTGSMGSTKDNASATATPAEAPLTDENIAAIAGAANTAEMEQGKLASTKAKDAKVKKFGAMMATEHGDVAKKHADLLKKTKMTPADNATSTMIASDSSKLMETLKTSTGADFDKAYVDAQVKEHTMLLDALDNKLIPGAKNADLKAELTAIRPKVEAHLKAAQDLQKNLGGASMGSTGAGTGTGMGMGMGMGMGGDKANATPKK